MAKPRIVAVDDDFTILALVSEHLSDLGLSVETFGTIKEACDRLSRPPCPNLVILDRNLPDGDGTQLRQVMLKDPELHNVPVLFMTVLEASQGRASVVREGADDYLIKPFKLEDLEARVRALLELPAPASGPMLRCGEVELDGSSYRATLAGKPMNLAPKELQALQLLLLHQGQVITENILLQKVWGIPFIAPDQNPVPQAIANLKAALAHRAGYLKGDPSVGYRLEAD